MAYRYRQFLIAVLGAGMVLGLGLVMAGLAGGFSAEISQTVGGVGAQRWVLTDSSRGQLSDGAFFSAGVASAIAREPGVTGTAALAILPEQVARFDGASRQVVVFGVQPGRMGSPAVTSGHGLTGSGQVVIDDKTGAATGSVITVGALSFRVVGQVAGRTILAGTPVVYMPLPDAQALAIGGRPLVTAVVTRGVPAAVPAGFTVLTSRQVEQANLSDLSGAISSLNNSKILMWVVAAMIVAALLYVSALQRVRDFAVLKALGSSSMALFQSLAVQAVVVTLLAAAFAMILANFLTGLFAQPVAIPASAFATLPLIAVGVGLVASLVAVRRATSADPAAAFGG